MRTVRITHANWVSDWLAGDAGAIRHLTDEQAYEAVEVLALAVYTDGGSYTPPPPPQADPVLTIEPVMTQEHVEANLELEEDFPITVTYGTEPLEEYDPVKAIEADLADMPNPGSEMKMPWTNASKAAWVDWAVYKGADPAEAAGLTKIQLMSRYGERM